MEPIVEESPLEQRQCGRCRGHFPGDPDLFFQTDWALCPDCEEILMGGPGGKKMARRQS